METELEWACSLEILHSHPWTWEARKLKLGRGKLDQPSLMHRIPMVNRENLDSHKSRSDLSTCKLWHECYTHRHRHTHWALPICQHWIMDNNSRGYGKRIQMDATGERASLSWLSLQQSEERRPHNTRASFRSLNPREYQLVLCLSQTLPKGISWKFSLHSHITDIPVREQSIRCCFTWRITIKFRFGQRFISG